MSAHDALMSFSKKQLNKPRTNRKKNKAPEKEMVKQIISWSKSNGMDLDVIEASGGRNQFGNITVKSGYSDISGNDKHGYAMYIEAKAAGKRNTLRANQYVFLLRKIKSGAFAVVADNVQSLSLYYYGWLEFKENGQHERAVKYLIENLYVPKQIRSSDGGLF